MTVTMSRLSAEKFLAAPPTKLATMYVVTGAEALAALEAADALRALARAAGYSERKVFTAESGFDWSQLANAGAELSLFATLRFVELRIPTGKPGKEGSAAIEQYCARLPDDTVTLVTLPEIDWRGKQAKWFVALERVATVIEALPVERAVLPAWLAGRLARQQQSASGESLEYLADRVEGNLLAAHQEIRKLGLLCPPGEISLETLEASVADVSRFDPFQLITTLTDASAVAKSPRLHRIMAGLKAEGEAAPYILWVLVNELRLLARLRGVTQGGYPPHPAKAKSLDRLARRHTAESLRSLLLHAAEVDRMVKGLNSRDPWEGLAALACGMAGESVLRAA